MALKEELDAPGDDAAPADDLRSLLSAAAEEQEAAVAPEKPAKPAKAAPASDASEGEDTPAKAAPKRAAAKPAKAAEAAEPEGEVEAKPEAKEAEPEGDETKAEGEKAEAEAKAETELTGKWSAKDKETFKALPPEGKDLFLRRHKEMEGAFTKKTQEVAAFRKDYEPIDKLLEPWQDRIKAHGWTKTSLITAWANAEKRLMDPNDGVQVVANLVKGYRLDVGKVAQALGLRANQPTARQQQDGEQPAAVQNEAAAALQLPPELTQQLQSLQERLDAQDRERADNARRAQNGEVQRVMTDIEKFKGAQDDKGQLLHPHFDELEEEMTSLAQAAMAARKPVPSLQDLYEKAVWANPSTREAKLAADKKAQQARAAEEARAKAAAAKKAGSSVTGAPGSGQAPAAKPRTDQTLREQLLAAAEEAEA